MQYTELNVQDFYIAIESLRNVHVCIVMHVFCRIPNAHSIHVIIGLLNPH